MEFLPEEIEKYAIDHTDKDTSLLSKIERDTKAEVLMPRMLSGNLQGRFLSFISKMIEPAKILEIGTYTGYSALCLAEGLANDGKLITLDKNEELESRVRNYFSSSAYANQIEYIVADARETIHHIEGPLDLVFIDADKVNYLYYYKHIKPKVRAGGWIIADNVLWSGKVVQPVKENDKETKALMEFNDFVHQDEEVENILLPLRDGLMIVRKK